jgi:hypothetical protein
MTDCYLSGINKSRPFGSETLGNLGMDNETLELIGPVVSSVYPDAQHEVCIMTPCKIIPTTTTTPPTTTPSNGVSIWRSTTVVAVLLLCYVLIIFV